VATLGFVGQISESMMAPFPTQRVSYGVVGRRRARWCRAPRGFDANSRQVINAIKEARASDLFPVSGTERYASQILKTNTLQFDSGASLILTRTDVPFVAICARRILLRAPDVRGTISRDVAMTGEGGESGQAGLEGIPGAPGQPFSANPDGGAGADGADGGPAADGRPATLPTVYFFGEQIRNQSGAPVQFQDLALVFPGIDGGEGGAGGDGGSGGPGGQGGHGWSSPPQCVSEQRAGHGGNGGRGGRGGAGGNGADGGDGATLIYVGPRTALEQFAWIKVVNGAGRGGAGGRGGRGGQGGVGGRGWRQTHPGCPSGRNGVDGIEGRPGRDGRAGAPGNKGTVTLITRASLDDLFS
jgi:hypothetical protein